MATSYQDIDIRLTVIEDKVKFLMDFFVVTRKEPSYLDPSQVTVSQATLSEVYRELRQMGATTEPVIDAEVIPTTED